MRMVSVSFPGDRCRQLNVRDMANISNRIVVDPSTTGTASDSWTPSLEWMENDDDEPIMPLQYRFAIVLRALMNYFRDMNDDVRSQEVDAAYTALIGRILDDNAYGAADRPQLQPRAAAYNQYRAKRPYRRGRRNHRYDLNGEFDRLEN